MEIKQIWMSPSSGKNNHYALHLSLGVVGIVLLMLLFQGFFQLDIQKSSLIFLLYQTLL